MYHDDDNDIDYCYDYDYYMLRLMTLITMLMVTRMSWKPWEDGMGGRIDRTNGSEVTQRLGNTCPHIPTSTFVAGSIFFNCSSPSLAQKKKPTNKLKIEIFIEQLLWLDVTHFPFHN